MSDFIEDAGGESPPEATNSAPPPAGPPKVGPAKEPIRCDGEAVTTLREAAELFFSKPGPRRLAAYAAAGWAARLALGKPVLGDLAVCGGVALYWPLQEWVMHKYLLHLPPREGRSDPLFAQRHRGHHVEPREVDLTLLPLEVLDVTMPANAALWLVLLGRRRTAVTGIAAAATMALLYEWTHFLVHTGYRPESGFFGKVRRYHRLHHYRNEDAWFGFTMPWVDEILGTAPDPRSVPFSKTARDLFGLRAKAADAAR